MKKANTRSGRISVKSTKLVSVAKAPAFVDEADEGALLDVSGLPSVFDVALAGADVRAAGAASGVLGTFDQIGSALGIAVVGVVFFGAIAGDFSSVSVREALLLGLRVPVVGLVVAAFASLLLPSTAAIRAHKAAADAVA